MARDKLKTVFPNFNFRGFLMDINGNCIQLEIKEKSEGNACKSKRSPL